MAAPEPTRCQRKVEMSGRAPSRSVGLPSDFPSFFGPAEGQGAAVPSCPSPPSETAGTRSPPTLTRSDQRVASVPNTAGSEPRGTPSRALSPVTVRRPSRSVRPRRTRALSAGSFGARSARDRARPRRVLIPDVAIVDQSAILDGRSAQNAQGPWRAPEEAPEASGA